MKRPTASVDWEAVAQALLAEAARPMLLFDARGVLRAANAPALQLVGDAVDRTWDTLFERSPQGESPTSILKDVLQGDESEWLVCARGSSLRCRGIAIKGGAAVLLTVTDSWRGAHRETAYQIAVTRERFGQIVGAKNPALIGRVCHEALWARGTPCEQCPAREIDERQQLKVWASEHGVDVVAAERINDHLAGIQVQRLDGDATQSILAARRARLAVKHGLSPREREVLDLMYLGRTTQEIATALTITLRTAKYHQSNVLEKLGLDSRLELLRLLS